MNVKPDSSWAVFKNANFAAEILHTNTVQWPHERHQAINTSSTIPLHAATQEGCCDLQVCNGVHCLPGPAVLG